MRSDPDVNRLLAALVTGVLRHTRRDGETPTALPGLSLLRVTSTSIEASGILRPSVCLVVQGSKIARAGTSGPLRYGAGDFLTTSIDMPLAGTVVGASRTKPYLALAFALPPRDVLSTALDAKLAFRPGRTDAPATFVGKCDARLLDVALRAVGALDSTEEAVFMGPLLQRELAYRLLTGSSGLAVYESARLARTEDGVGRAVEWVREHFREPLRIERLARVAKMSASSLHHRFKAVVRMGPLQYQKRLRLEEARRLLMCGLTDATRAAYDVGYASSSQFSRDYRKRFGAPPLREVRRALVAGSGNTIAEVGKKRGRGGRIVGV